MGQKAAGTRRPRTKTTNPPPIQTKDMFTRTSTTLRAAALVALAVLACLATGASAQSRRLQGGAPYFNANFGGGIGKLFGAATNDFMQGGVGAVTDAAVNSYHEVVPPAHFEKLLGRRALQDYNSIHAASQGNIGSGGTLGLWAKSAGGAVTEAAMLAGEAGLHAVAPNIPINNPDPEGDPFADN